MFFNVVLNLFGFYSGNSICLILSLYYEMVWKHCKIPDDC